eukprot:TRINITY_DN16001_c0_g1_i2.p1 TRINITY_DN16001_c0_g1~~TRINITY_DN16001_c0_g1_i2.p1  ORF type:complete len:526 (-),score=118.61 TRINITY_DN16001_c0_g1_i2:369-1946(-)
MTMLQVRRVAASALLTVSSAEWWLADALPPRAHAEATCDDSLKEICETETLWQLTAQSSRGIGWCDCVLDRELKTTPLHAIASRASRHSGSSAGIVAGMVAKLAKGGARVLAPDSMNATALHIAAARGVLSASAALIGLAANEGLLREQLNAVDAARQTPLAAAEVRGHVQVAALLVSWGSRLEDWSGGRGGTQTGGAGQCSGVLMNAVLNANANAIRDLIVTDAAHIPDCVVTKEDSGGGAAGGQKLGWTLLHYAVAAAELVSPSAASSVVEALLDFGANASRQDAAGETALHEAVRHDQVAVARVLLERMPAEAMGLKDVLGRTALHVASNRGSTASTSLLLQYGAPLHDRDNTGRTPLDTAEWAGHSEVAQKIQTAIHDPMGYYGALRNGSSEFAWTKEEMVWPTTTTAAPAATDPAHWLLAVVGVIGLLFGLACALGLYHSAYCLQLVGLGGKPAVLPAPALADCGSTSSLEASKLSKLAKLEDDRGSKALQDLEAPPCSIAGGRVVVVATKAQPSNVRKV